MDSGSVSRRLPRSKAWPILLAVLVALAAPLAYYRLFNVFRWWDDEGYLLISIASLLRGFKLYEQIFTQYGPFYYLVAWVTYHVPGVALDNTTPRVFLGLYWLGCAALCGFVVQRTVRNAALAALTFTAVFFHLAVIRNEPGHPQGMVVFMIALAAAMTPLAPGRSARAWPIALGVLCGALAMTKINLGTFLSLSSALAFATFARMPRALAWVRPFLWLVALALPFLLMRLHLLEEHWTLAYALSVACIVLALAIALWRKPAEPPLAFGQALAFAAALALTVAVVLVLARALGTSWRGLAYGIVGQHLDFAKRYTAEAPMRLWFLPCGAAALVLVFAHYFRRPLPPLVLALLKLAFGALAFVLSLLDATGPLLGCAGPFLWLALPTLDRARASDARALGASDLPRVALVLVAMLQSLQAYPVGGSQMFWATLLLLPAAAICLADATAYFVGRASEAHRGAPFESLRTPATLLVGAALAALFATQLAISRARYRESVPLELPGTGRLRLPEFDVATLRWLAYSLEPADSFYTRPGSFSLFFWTHKDPPTAANIPFWTQLLPVEKQQEIVAALERSPRALFVERSNPPLDLPPQSSTSLPLAYYLRTQFQPVGQVGYYELRARADWTPPPAHCALLRGEEARVYVPARAGVARKVEIKDLPKLRVFASTDAASGVAGLEIEDERGTRIALDGATGGIDLSRGRELVVRPSDPKVCARIERAGIPAVRLLGADGTLLATLPFVR